MIELFPYQEVAKDQILTWTSSNDAAVAHTLVAPMSAGKTLLSGATIDVLVQQGKRVWVVVNREELVDQWKNELSRIATSLKSHSRDVGIIMGGVLPAMYRPVQLVMVQTLTQRLKTIADKHKPDVIFYDEAHETRFQRIANKLKQRWPDVHEILLTATPVRHGKSPVQYSDLFSKDTWHVVKTAREMIGMGRWKTPIWKSASDELAESTAIRFTGMKQSGGDYDDTSQAQVMMDLLPGHLADWKKYGGDKHHCVWFVVNVEHAHKVVKALQGLGRRAIAITGQSNKKERRDAIEAFKNGEIDDLVNCQCLTTGFDAPIASCAVWLRRTLSVGLFNQMAGRVLRKFDGITKALMLDLAGNLAIHPFPELMDWMEFDPCQRMFRDPNTVMCRSCGYRHDAIPTPIHPTDRKIGWLTGMACFKDGLEISLKSIISCHDCNSPVYADPEKLKIYGDWLKSCVVAKVSGKKPPQFSGTSAGISIGIADDTKTPLTPELLYETGVWRLTEGGEKPEKTIKDRSQEYRDLRVRLAKNFEQKELCDLRFTMLNQRQQQFLLGCNVASLKAITDNAGRYRTAIAYAYINDKSPVWAFPYWDKAYGAINKSEISKALTSIWAGNPETFALLEQWLERHIEIAPDHKKRGIVQSFLTLLNGLSIRSVA